MYKTNHPFYTKKNVESYYYFYVPVRFGNSIYTVKLFAEQKKGEKEINPNVVHLYDVVEIKKLGKLSRSYQLSHLPSTISITEMLSGVKDYKGNPYLFEEQKEQVKLNLYKTNHPFYTIYSSSNNSNIFLQKASTDVSSNDFK